VSGLFSAIIAGMETLEKLFGSAAKVKIMRLFIFNPDQFFTTKLMVQRTRLTSSQIRKELGLLEKIKLLKTRGQGVKKVWYVNDTFVHLTPLRELMTHSVAVSFDSLVRKIGKTCKLKALVLSGLFINHPESRVDMLIIGNQFNRDSFARTIKKLESEIGKELSYAVLETEDFRYRMGIGDRLVRDILEFPHQVAYDKLGVK
jgi:putative transposon-encoded protein